MDNLPQFIFGIFGNTTAPFLFLAPTNKSTQQFSGIPYVMTLLNCFLSARYGLPFVSPNNLLVSAINSTGAAIELISLIFAPRKGRIKILTLFLAITAIFSTVAIVSILALDGQVRKHFCGSAVTIISIIMYASP